jgi:hypothetical protein
MSQTRAVDADIDNPAHRRKTIPPIFDDRANQAVILE